MSKYSTIIETEHKIISVRLDHQTRGWPRIDIRELYLDASGAMRHSRRGIMIPAGHLPNVINSLIALQNQLIADGYADLVSDERTSCEASATALPTALPAVPLLHVDCRSLPVANDVSLLM